MTLEGFYRQRAAASVAARVAAHHHIPVRHFRALSSRREKLCHFFRKLLAYRFRKLNRAILKDKVIDAIIEHLMAMPDYVPGSKRMEEIPIDEAKEFIAWLEDAGGPQCDAATDEGRFDEFLEEFLSEFKAKLARSDEAVKRREQEDKSAQGN